MNGYQLLCRFNQLPAPVTELLFDLKKTVNTRKVVEGSFYRGRALVTKAVINRFCVNHDGGVCRICADACEYSAISFHVRDSASASLEIDLEKCTGCGQCYRSCPRQAIRVKPV